MAKLSGNATASPRSDNAASSAIAVVLKATNLVECFSRRGGELALKDLVAMSGYPTSTVHRLLATLEKAGWVIRRRNGYCLSLRITEIASRVLADLDLREEARPLMQRLSRESGETTYLVMRQADHAVCVERVEGDRMVRVMAWDVGSTLPLYAGAAPLALLAYESPDEIDRLTDLLPLVLPIGKPTSRSELLDRLRLTREFGWSFSRDETIEGIASIGAPIFGRAGAPVAALSVGGLATGFGRPARDKMAVLLLSAADALSRQIGYTGPSMTSASRPESMSG